MATRLEIQGDKYSRLTVLRDDGVTKHNHRKVVCVCDCGKTISTTVQKLRCGDAKSCGCLYVEGRRAINLKHGHAPGGNHTSEYTTYRNMLRRCNDPKFTQYEDYGGRGIKIYPEWIGTGGFELFLTHMGKKPTPKHSIDRINNGGNYEPGNVKWSTPHEQGINKRKRLGTASQYIGVTRHRCKWRARAVVGGRYKHLGYFSDEHLAGAAVLALR